jgi:hypothetical protein
MGFVITLLAQKSIWDPIAVCDAAMQVRNKQVRNKKDPIA